MGDHSIRIYANEFSSWDYFHWNIYDVVFLVVAMGINRNVEPICLIVIAICLVVLSFCVSQDFHNIHQIHEVQNESH
jgi:hypothetical protein